MLLFSKVSNIYVCTSYRYSPIVYAFMPEECCWSLPGMHGPNDIYARLNRNEIFEHENCLYYSYEHIIHNESDWMQRWSSQNLFHSTEKSMYTLRNYIFIIYTHTPKHSQTIRTYELKWINIWINVCFLDFLFCAHTFVNQDQGIMHAFLYMRAFKRIRDRIHRFRDFRKTVAFGSRERKRDRDKGHSLFAFRFICCEWFCVKYHVCAIMCVERALMITSDSHSNLIFIIIAYNIISITNK